MARVAIFLIENYPLAEEIDSIFNHFISLALCKGMGDWAIVNPSVMASETGSSSSTVPSPGNNNISSSTSVSVTEGESRLVLGVFWTNQATLSIILVLGNILLIVNLILFVTIYRRSRCGNCKRNGDNEDADPDNTIHVNSMRLDGGNVSSINWLFPLPNDRGYRTDSWRIEWLRNRLNRWLIYANWSSAIANSIRRVSIRILRHKRSLSIIQRSSSISSPFLLVALSHQTWRPTLRDCRLLHLSCSELHHFILR